MSRCHRAHRESGSDPTPEVPAAVRCKPFVKERVDVLAVHTGVTLVMFVGPG